MKSRLLTVLLILTFSGSLQADEELAPYAHVIAANGGRYYAKVVPQKGTRDKGKVTVYSVRRDGPDQKLYVSTGWYGFKVYLSYNGQYLVRLGNWPRGRKPSKDHLAIAFYKRGKLLKRYSTADLIKDPSKIQASVSHYQYLKRAIGFKRGFSDHFTIITTDNMQYTFDAASGKILKSKQLP